MRRDPADALPAGRVVPVKVEASPDEVTMSEGLVVSASAEAEHGGEVGGDEHGGDGAHVGAAGVAERVAAHRRAGTGDDEAAELADDLVSVAIRQP